MFFFFKFLNLVVSLVFRIPYQNGKRNLYGESYCLFVTANYLIRVQVLFTKYVFMFLDTRTQLLLAWYALSYFTQSQHVGSGTAQYGEWSTISTVPTGLIDCAVWQMLMTCDLLILQRLDHVTCANVIWRNATIL